jgi:hypothetical protein
MTAPEHGTQFKPEIVTGQYNSHAGISNVKNPTGGYISWWAWQVEARIEKNRGKYCISNIKRYLVLKYITKCLLLELRFVTKWIEGKN